MSERLLHFIWRFQYFNKGHLSTTTGECVRVVFPGQYNNNQGPDFLGAKINIAHTLWAGTVELHIKTSDWNRHHHHKDRNYNNVVLHVVWEDDVVSSTIPVLELKSRVPKILLQRYEELMNAVSFIPCEKSIHTVIDIIWKSWKDRLVAERLIRKVEMIETWLQQNNYHWEETFWWLLARNFGIKVNAELFEAIARSVPFALIAKYRNNLVQLEALLMGRAGLLEDDFQDEYSRNKKREYEFQQRKHKFHGCGKVLFLRMRPGSFPTIRLSQLAMLLHNSTHLLSQIKELNSIDDVKKCFDVTASEYWDHHYRFDKPSPYRKKRVSTAMIDNIIINTVVPMLFAYGNYHKEEKYKEKAIRWLEETAAEKNAVINGFEKAGISSNNAYDSQSLIELKNEYCNKKRCLDCAIGNVILRG